MVTLGDFDGVHLGHQKLLEHLVLRARQSDSRAVVILFVSPPGEVRQRKDRLPLTDLRQRLTLLASLGVTVAVLVRPRRETYGPSEVQAVVADLLDRVGASRVLLGELLEVGASRISGLELRGALQGTSRCAVEIVPDVEMEGRRVESDTVRRKLLQCDFASLQRLLGRPYSLAGRVVHGHHRGRQIGVPTVNLHLRGVQLPPDGVYAVRVRVDDDDKRDLQGVANIGYKPTFGDPERTLETHLLDFEGDLYGRRLAVRFAHRIRSERKFPDVGALVEQIRRDIDAVRDLLGSDG